MTKFFTSDLHFGHKGILHLGKGRPFSTIEEMDMALINNWNAKVGRGDEVYVLGDFSFHGADHTGLILSMLNGQKFLIIGNHDRRNIKSTWRDHFVWIRPYEEISVMDGGNKQKIVLCHYPFKTWNQSHRGSWNLHGHCHGNLQEGIECLGCGETTSITGRQLDVGVDVHGFAPVSYDEVKALISEKEIVNLDHHK